MIDGPGGTGKSINTGRVLHWICETFPGTAILVVRMTRASLTDSWMYSFEEQVIPEGHYLLEGAGRANRREYAYANGSRIVLGGLDKPSKLYSTEWNWVHVVEAQELPTHEPWQKFHRSLRPRKGGLGIPLYMLSGECNPDSTSNWIYKRWMERDRKGNPIMGRMKTTHRDNPAFWDEDRLDWTPEGREYVLERLAEGMSGVTRKRLYEGIWCSAEGAVYPDYDEHRHVIDAECIKDGEDWYIQWKGKARRVKIEFFLAGQDFGMSPTHPGCQQVWGFDADHRMYLVEEYYMTGKNHDWWAGVCEATFKKYGWREIACDWDKNAIDVFNDRLGKYGKRGVGARAEMALKGPNSVELGIGEVSRRLALREDSKPALYLLRDCLAHPVDADLKLRGWVTSTQDEFPLYVWDQRKANDIAEGFKEVPKKIKDDGMDTMRYVVLSAHQRDYKPKPKSYVPEPGTWAHHLTKGGKVKRPGFYGAS